MAIIVKRHRRTVGAKLSRCPSAKHSTSSSSPQDLSWKLKLKLKHFIFSSFLGCLVQNHHAIVKKMSSGNPEKAARYIESLDTARSEGRWSEVPELVRKVRKHAPQRKCLTLTAESECHIATRPLSRPTTASSITRSTLTDLVPPLLAAIEEATLPFPDVTQAQSCLGWIHYTLNEPSLAISRLPEDFDALLKDTQSEEKRISGWTLVCILRSVYIKGFSQEKSLSPQDAIKTYQSALPFFEKYLPASNSPPQRKLWTERSFAHFCILAREQARIDHDSERIATTLTAFRLWAIFCDSVPTSTAVDVARPQIWKAYYDFLSIILQKGFPYVVSSTKHAEAVAEKEDDNKIPPRMQQATELKRVQTIFENTLLKQVRFPKANESNEEMEAWVDQVIANWKILCGPTWQDDDLGEGGQNAVGRNVLDILYRAATKSYHSTTILRHLFTVHIYLAEFDLAFKAFDSYVEIVTRGNARAEKSGEIDPGLDDDNTVLRTAAEAIRVLCQFGGTGEAEKAKDLGSTLEKWLARHHPDLSPQTVNGDKPSDIQNGDSVQDSQPKVSPKTLAIAYRALGISQAHWARITFDPIIRAEFQTKAVKSLQTALSPDFGDINNIESLYALGLLFAEKRSLNQALKVLKQALAVQDASSVPRDIDGVISEDSPLETRDVGQGDYVREHKLIPVWHLIALLLSAKQDFENAEKACEAAIEQFSLVYDIFGHARKASSGSKVTTSDKYAGSGITDTMLGMEKERIIEVRMTQLALVEVLEGPEVAVNSSDELLSLFAKLFRGFDMEKPRREEAESLVPPKSSAGTIKSITGSIFGRRKTARNTPLTQNSASTLPQRSQSEKRTRSASGGSDAPVIHVTDEHGKVPKSDHSLYDIDQNEDKSVRRDKSVTRKLRRKSCDNRMNPVEGQEWEYTSDSRPTSVHSAQPQPISLDQRPASPDDVGVAVSVNIPSPPRPATSGHDQSRGAMQPLPRMRHNIPFKKYPPPPGHRNQPPRQDVRLPTISPFSSSTQPEPKFPQAQEEKHAFGVLIKIWLLIAGLYRRANMFEDARGACDEAESLIERVESLVAVQDSSARGFAEASWGGNKSVDELWSDLFTERGYLAMARTLPYEALDNFEQALAHRQEHPSAIVGLSNILLDIYSEITPPEPPSMDTNVSTIYGLEDPVIPDGEINRMMRETSQSGSPKQLNGNGSGDENGNINPTDTPILQGTVGHRKTPESLNRLAARDRAYGLLSNLTKLGTGWDFSEAWFALARAYEESGQVQKAKDVLWFCVELEDGRPIRHWRNVGGGGCVL
ncbi:MAG: hypothetical protein M1834_006154 [Cirrosporium novae-zelandiae]|nr:MAG: hypothetical protein M1834_006154 [Cirrosporium novae-zelandiae]